MPKNIVICCDGTGNEANANLSNVLKLYRILRKNEDQLVFYDSGIGTLSSNDAWSRLKNEAKVLFSLLAGYGLDQNILDAYGFLVDHHVEHLLCSPAGELWPDTPRFSSEHLPDR
jgi:uncharacterized protein (DUF2235 family)